MSNAEQQTCAPSTSHEVDSISTRLSIVLNEEASLTLERLTRNFGHKEHEVIEKVLFAAEGKVLSRLSEADCVAYQNHTLDTKGLQISKAGGENLEHQQLFAIPTRPAPHVPSKPYSLPERKPITGDLEIDSYLWLCEVCASTTSFAHLEKAERSAAKIETQLDELERRYAAHLIAQGIDPLTAAFSSMFEKVSELAEKARERISTAMTGLAAFGSYEQAMLPTPAEQMLKRTVRERPEGEYWSWTQAELAKLFERSVNPATLTEAAAELRYWEWLYKTRRRMQQTRGGAFEEDRLISARRSYAANLLCELKPQGRAEIRHLISEVRSGLMEISGVDDSKKHADIFEHLLRSCVMRSG